MATLSERSGARSGTRPDIVHVLAPTLLEYLAIRTLSPSAHVSLSGVGLARSYPLGECPLIVCGLAGALTGELVPGSVVVPDEVGLETGGVVSCDPALVEALRRGARTAGHTPLTGRLLTARSMVTGDSRSEWASRGFQLVDMETGQLFATGRRIATVRVILDAPCRPIADDWLDPWRALRQPRLWSELLWLGHAAPRYALRAARVLRAGLAILAEPRR